MVSGTQTVCGECKGSGLQIHTSGQDAIYFPLPDTPDEMFDLDKILVYKQPPIDLIKFQDEYVRNLKKDAHLSVYNSNMFLAEDPQFAKTATEHTRNFRHAFSLYGKVFGSLENGGQSICSPFGFDDGF